MAIKFRKEMSNVKPYQQGKPAEVVQREFGLDRIEKLASNENQFGPSPMAIEAMKKELSLLNFYPEGHPFELVRRLSEYHGLDENRFAVGNGGEALIWNLSMVMLDPGDEIVITSPTFDIYKLAATYLGANTVAIPMDGLDYNVRDMVDAITDKTKIVWLCSPNNPTGNIASREDIDYLVENVPDDIVLVLDEAYYDFAAAKSDFPKDSLSLLERHENIVVLRSFSKVFGLAGIRIGYIVTSETIASKVNAVKFTFGVNRLAQVGARAALDDTQYLSSIIEKNKAAIDRLEAYYQSKNWDYFPSYANFSWVNCREDSRLIFDALQRKGVIIRPGYHWGWDTWIRISTGREEQMDYLLEKFDEVLMEIHE